MYLSSDSSALYTNYITLKQEILDSLSSASNLSSSDKDLVNYRESQLRSLIEVSANLTQLLQSAPQSSDESLPDLKRKCLKLENLYSVSEENLKKSRAEVKYLKTEIQSLEKNRGDNNLFTVEVYQSEIEDLKKDFAEKVAELEGNLYLDQILTLQSSKLQKSYVELKNKYNKVKSQLISLRTKIQEFEEVLAVNNEQKKATEMKYIELVNTHKKMFGYIEKLELKVRKFHDNKKKQGSLTSSKEDSRSLISI